MSYSITFKPFGESAILIEWPSKIDEDILKDIISFDKLIRQDQKVINTIIAYNSITVLLKKWDNYSDLYNYKKRYQNKVDSLKSLYDSKREINEFKSKVWKIPVCYDSQFGIDLEEIATNKNISVKELVRLHTQPKYLVYFIGFQPGFLYLGGLDSKIHIPRKKTPRIRVDKGSVAIGGEQTGVYPEESSGGWNIIGRTPVSFFDVSKHQPCFAKAGDRVQFYEIDLETHHQIAFEVANGSFRPKFSFGYD